MIRHRAETSTFEACSPQGSPEASVSLALSVIADQVTGRTRPYRAADASEAVTSSKPGLELSNLHHLFRGLERAAQGIDATRLQDPQHMLEYLGRRLGIT